MYRARDKHPYAGLWRSFERSDFREFWHSEAHHGKGAGRCASASEVGDERIWRARGEQFQQAVQCAGDVDLVEHIFTLVIRALLVRDAMIPNFVKDCQRRARNSR